MASRNSGNSFILFIIPALGSLAIYIAIAYFLKREDSFLLITGFLLLFLAYLSFIFNTITRKQVYWLVYLSVIYRLSFLFALPNLSDDFYRFIWDGRLFLNEIHPFAYVPAYFMSISHELMGITGALYAKLNSPEYYTIYPPVCQVLFAAAAWLFPESLEGSTLILRLFIIGAETGTLLLILNILKANNLPQKKILFYALNPLVIIELAGNLHFEAVMIFFLLCSLYFFNKNRLITSAVFYSLSICTKLIPLIFLPLFIKRLGWKNALAYYCIIGSLCYIIFIPFLTEEFVRGFTSSFMLYFSHFEFNASLYYILRGIGYLLVGHNIIAVAGTFLAFAGFISILIYTKKETISKHSVYESCMWVLLIYLLFTTTLHPWYIIPLLSLSIFTKYRFPIVWSFLIFFTYLNYSLAGYRENLYIVFFEYVFLIAFLLFELKYYPTFREFKQSLRKRFVQQESNFEEK